MRRQRLGLALALLVVVLGDVVYPNHPVAGATLALVAAFVVEAAWRALRKRSRARPGSEAR